MATEENVECEVDGRPVSKLKVDELKVELDKRGLKKSGVKKELQERLIEYLRTHSDNSGSSDLQSSSPTKNDNETSGTDPEVLSSQGHSQESEHDVPKDISEDNVKNEKESNLSGNIDPNVTNKDAAELEDGEISVQDKSADKKDQIKSADKKDQKSNNPEKKRRISLTRQTSSTNPAPGGRKRKWNSTSGKSKSSVVISTGSLKGLIPGVQLASTPALEAVMDLDDDKEDEEATAEKEKDDEEKEHENGTEDNEDQEEVKILNKKTRIVQIEESKKVILNQTTEVESENNDMDVNQEQHTEDMATEIYARDVFIAITMVLSVLVNVT